VYHFVVAVYIITGIVSKEMLIAFAQKLIVVCTQFVSHILFIVIVDLNKIKSFLIKVIHITTVIRSLLLCSVLCSSVTIPVDLAQFSRFHLKTETECSLQNVVF
jgi:hypothetical protein